MDNLLGKGLKKPLLFVVFAFLLQPALASGQNQGCKGLSDNATFKVLHSSRTLAKRELQLQIFVKPKLFEVESMVTVRQQIRKLYCDEQSLMVTIFDRPRPPADLILDPTGRRSGARGLYLFNAESDEILFRHSNESEIEIKFSSGSDYCVSISK